MSATSFHLPIQGEPYVLTRNEWGFQVVHAEDSSRAYQVWLLRDTNKAARCSCPDCINRRRVCKHMKAVESLLTGTAKPDGTFVLASAHSRWTATYRVSGDTVTVEQTLNGVFALPVRSMTREEARDHYAMKLLLGYRPM